MNLPEHYDNDVLFFFDRHPRELALYEAFFALLEGAFPGASVKVQKSQVSFYGRHLFAAVSLPVRRKKGWPEEAILITLGLPYRCGSERIAVAVEPYPGRWSHHILVSRGEELDGELMGWVRESWAFSESKR